MVGGGECLKDCTVEFYCNNNMILKDFNGLTLNLRCHSYLQGSTNYSMHVSWKIDHICFSVLTCNWLEMEACAGNINKKTFMIFAFEDFPPKPQLQATILDKINGTSGPSPPHPASHFNDAKMARFCFFPPSLLLGGRRGLLFLIIMLWP